MTFRIRYEHSDGQAVVTIGDMECIVTELSVENNVEPVYVGGRAVILVTRENRTATISFVTREGTTGTITTPVGNIIQEVQVPSAVEQLSRMFFAQPTLKDRMRDLI